MQRFLTIFCLTIFYSISALAGIIRVPQDTTTIQAGINIAATGDTVLVADGTYLENINFKGKSITVASYFLADGDANHINNTIIDGSQLSHPDSGSVVSCYSGEDTTSVLLGFTITGGTGTIVLVAGGTIRIRMGGGIYINNGAGLKISNNRIINNTVTNSNGAVGGGMVSWPTNLGGFVVLENNVFEANSVHNAFISQGGGASVGCDARIINNIFRNNLVVSSTNGEAFGGGLVSGVADFVLVYGNLIINNKVQNFTGNGALGGGFMFFRDSTAFIRMTGNIITHNEAMGSNWSAGAGGCIEETGGDFLFANNLVTDNFYSGTANCHGTGLAILDYTMINIINNTFTNNEATPYGGALCTWRTISTVSINNIFWGNSAGASMPEIYIWEGPSPQITYSNVQTGWIGTGNINVDPLFVPGDTLYHLVIGSPCINAGNPDSLCNDYDGTRNDMGAYGGIPDSLAKFINIILKIEDKIEIPQKYILYQNYPNPFNPTTTIGFDLPKSSEITLKIYNILGEEVATLLSGQLLSGSYQYEWDASGLASGVYLYRLEAGNRAELRKLVLLK